MFERIEFPFAIPDTNSYVKLVRKLGETFVVRDVMVQLPLIRYVKPGDITLANQPVHFGGWGQRQSRAHDLG